ncbi:protein FAR1-RELATED SEQUENCE 5-like [Cannabis sativa]|uniref:protein FAR1-RELATED SEQUENCE 5-like n=1 Tax=Cannabis sativa TaxID=3483 RepID=UPI0029C9E373|nr:protein FAR1-RELATED SEQUENCE 5-like [Cannabis sativa]
MADEENNLRSSQNEVEVIKIPEHEVENNGDRAHVQEANDEDVEETKDEEGHVNEELAQPDIAQWTILLQFLGIDKEPEDIEFSDFNGKEFLSIEQAESFYMIYSKIIGFGVRKKIKRELYSKEIEGLIVTNRSWVCSNEGYREKKYINMENRSSKARDLTRTGCRAEFRINLNRETGMWVTKCFRTHHNHALGSAIQKPFLRSKRKLTKSTMEQLMLMKRAGIGTSQVWQYLVEVSDGWENVGCMKDDLYKGVIKKYSTWDACDTPTAIAYLEAKKGPDPNFFYKYEVDDENRLTNLFWSDNSCRIDYQLFGDCLSFDSTYKTNKYEKPLVILLGSSNHDKTGVFGVALLEKENWETNNWVLETFLECMDGKMPLTVLTDNCKSMDKALSNVMPDVEEWEHNWMELLEKYDLANNKWIKDQYKSRDKWADTYLRGHYFGGARATGRCESMNALLKKDLQNKIPLWMFLRHFDHALSMLRYTEIKEHYKTTMTQPLLNQTNMECMEDQISSIFTREIFKRIKEQLNRSDKYIVVKDEKIPGYTLCLVKKYMKGENGIKRKVLISNDHDDVRCDCYWFETKGIPCRHIFISLKNLEIMNFPTCLVKSRWLNDAKDMQSATLGIERRCPHPEVIENSRYSSVTSQTCITSYLASRSQEAFEKAMSVISNLNAELKKIPPDKEFNILNKNEGEFPNNILDSKILKTRGRPTIASSSRSSPQGKDKNKRKSDDRHCAICSGTDHDKRNCPTKPKLTTDSPTQPKLPSKENDQAKKKMKVNM